MEQAHAFWLAEPGRGEIRAESLRTPGPDEVLVRALRSGISRGTETLVFRGEVPADQHQAMRAPFQEGEFPGPVKYGYLSVGVVERGPEELEGRRVFCLHPHQTAYVVPADAVTPLPPYVPTERAVLTGTVETALNAVWDAAPLIGDRIAVVGGGMVGCCIAQLVGRIPGTRVTLVDTEPSRASVADALGVGFAAPADARDGCDVVFHASATSAGLQRSLELLAPEGRVIDVSWYGGRSVSVPLGSAFHSRRLTIRSSQVGTIAPTQQGRRSHPDRMRLAMELLEDGAFDALLTGTSTLAELPSVLAELANGDRSTLCHSIDYQEDV